MDAELREETPEQDDARDAQFDPDGDEDARAQVPVAAGGDCRAGCEGHGTVVACYIMSCLLLGR